MIFRRNVKKTNQTSKTPETVKSDFVRAVRNNQMFTVTKRTLLKKKKIFKIVRKFGVSVKECSSTKPNYKE